MRLAHRSLAKISQHQQKKKRDVQRGPAIPKRTDEWGLDNQKEMLSIMPLLAQPQGDLDATMKSYTIVEADVEDGPKITSQGSSPIQVLLP